MALTRLAAPDRVVVVGGGLGGLYAACYLARRGVDVTVMERRDVLGGCCSGIEVDGYRFSIGPTMLQTPRVLEEAFEDLDRTLEQSIELARLEELYTVRFADGMSLGLHASLEETARRIADIAPRDVGGFHAYVEDMDRLKRSLKRVLVTGQGGGPRARDFVSADARRIYARLPPWRSARTVIERYFGDPRIRDAFSFQPLYLGSSPFTIPAIYAIVPYFELTMGVWHMRGGLPSLATALAGILEEEGGRVETGADVVEIEVHGGAVRGVRTADGRSIPASVVISNADVIHTYSQLLPRSAVSARYRRWIAGRRLSCSAELAFLAASRESLAGLPVHLFDLPRDLRAAFADLFRGTLAPTASWSYLYADETAAPDGRTALSCLIPVPHEAPGVRARSASQVRESAMERIAALGIDDAAVLRTLAPADYREMLNQTEGAVFGPRLTRVQSGPLRPSVRSRAVDGLFLAGAGTHPGPGVPLVVSSGRRAAKAALEWLSEGRRASAGRDDGADRVAF